MSEPTATLTGTSWIDRRHSAPTAVWALTTLWSLDEPHRVGEVAFIGPSAMLGRGGEGTGPRLSFVRSRPGAEIPRGPLQSARISRDQVWLEVDEHHLVATRRGRRAMRINGLEVEQGRLGPGDVLEVDATGLWWIHRRPRRLTGTAEHRFGAADAHGMVGESVAMSDLRHRLREAARAQAHVLVTGPSGSGKELAARAIHALSDRRSKPCIARNAATLPAGLVDAELFGSARNYPNPGMPERPGLIGAASGGVLFLDELGELPASTQSHLLRVIDEGGEYHRLGEAKPRVADVRLVAATNRDPEELKLDLRMRLPVHIEVPGLDTRPEDIGLLLPHLLTKRPPDIAARFMPDGVARVTPALLTRLVRHRWTGHVRELDTLLWAAITHAQDDVLRAVPAVMALLEPSPPPASTSLGADDIHAALQAHDGSVSKAARALGLSSRYVLYRLMKRHGIER